MSELALPKVDQSTILNRDKIVNKLKRIIKSENVLDHNDEIKPYETDALSAYKQKPLVVVPYFSECTPPEFSATFPPIEHANWLEGSGA